MLPTKNSKNIYIDLDDTVYDAGSLIINYFNQLCNKNLTPADIFNYDLRKVYGINTQEMIEGFYRMELIEKIKPYDYVVNNVVMLKNAGFCVTAITSRSWNSNAKELTQQSLDRYGLEVDELIIVPDGSSKGDYMAKEGLIAGCDYFIDDHAYHAVSVGLANPEATVFLIDKSWNKNEELPDNVIRVVDANKALSHISVLELSEDITHLGNRRLLEPKRSRGVRMAM